MKFEELVRWLFVVLIVVLLSTCKPIDIDYIDKRGQEVG